MAGGVAAELKVVSKHSTVYGIANLLNRAISFLLLPLYTRYLTPADYGTLDLLYFTTAFIGMIVDMGIGAAMSRYYFDSEDQKERNLAVSSAFYGFGVGSGFLILFFISISGFLSDLVFRATSQMNFVIWMLSRLSDATPVALSHNYSGLMILSLAGLALDIFVNVSYNYLRIRQRSIRLTVVAMSRLIMQIGFNVLFLVGFGWGVAGILVSAVIVNGVLVAYLVPSTLKEVGVTFSWPKLKGMITYGLPLIPSNILAYIVNVSDRFFVNAYVGLAQTGLYTLGYRFGILVNEFVSSPFAQIWVPRRFEMFQKPDAERVFARIFTYFAAALFFVGLVISVATKDVIRIMSEEAYWDAYLVVPIIVLAYIVSSFQMHFNVGIMFKKKTKYLMYINFVTGGINILLNFIMISRWGMWGAAWATLICFVIKVALIYVVGNRLVKIAIEWVRVLKLVAIAAVMYVAITPIETGSAVLNLTVKSILCLVYPFALYAVKFFEPGELTKGWEFARPYLGKVIPRFRD